MKQIDPHTDRLIARTTLALIATTWITALGVIVYWVVT
jgi:type VI protein secretion system component VasF